MYLIVLKVGAAHFHEKKMEEQPRSVVEKISNAKWTEFKAV